MSIYPKRVYPHGYTSPGVTVNSEEEEKRAMGIKDPVVPAPAVPLSSTSAYKAPAPKQEKKAAKSKRK